MNKNRKINLIVIHCSATRVTQDFTVGELEACHLARGFRDIGYHYYITKDGVIYPCRPESEPGAHARHYNAHSIGICYEGGLDANGRPADTRTPAQKAAMRELLKSLCTDYPEAEILGHRDLPGVNKECPCFDVKKWFPTSISTSSLLLSSNINFRTHLIHSFSPPILCSRIRLGLFFISSKYSPPHVPSYFGD